MLVDGTLLALQPNRNSKGTDEYLPGQAAELFFRLATNRSHDSVVPSPRRGMVQRISAHEENLRKLLIVICHHGGAWCLLRHRKEVVHVLDGAECLLPKLELNGSVELCKACVKMVL